MFERGFEVLEWIRNKREHARTPVVVFSSSTREDDRAKARMLGATDPLQRMKTLGVFLS